MDRLQANKSATFDDFTSLIYQLLKVAWGSEWSEKFMHAFPNGTDPANVDLPIITYYSKRKKPGIVGKGTQEIKPRFRSYHDHEGKMINVYAQVFDHQVVFEIFEETNAKADQLAEKFEEFMMTYTGYFMQNGVQQIIFLEQTDETASMEWSDSAVVRSYRYLVRLEKHVEVSTSKITEIIGKVGAFNADQPNDSIDEESIDFKMKEGGNTQ